MNKHDFQALAASGAKKICCPECFAPYECEHKDRNRRHVRCPKIGTDTECPLAKYHIEHERDPKPWYQRPASEVEATEAELFALCATCEHARLTATETECNCERTGFKEHCCDCPVMSAIDNLNEARAESAGG